MKAWWFLFALTLFPIPLKAAERIEEIRVQGNTKTDSDVIINISGLEEGQEFTQRLLRNARDQVLSSGLFSQVHIKKIQSSTSDGNIIEFQVKEKISWFFAPVFQYSESQLSGGFVFGEGNFLGRYKQLVLFGDYGPDGRRLVGAYRDPSVLGTDITFLYDGVFRWEKISTYRNREEIAKARVFQYGATLMPGYRWSSHFVSSIGAYVRKVDQKMLKGQNELHESVFTSGKDIAIVLDFEYDSTVNYDGLQHGAKISLSSQLSDNRFFSDFDYFKQELRFLNGLVFLNRQYNWITKASLQLGKDLPYYQEYTSGGTNLRGYLHRQFRGDTKYALTQEFYFPVHTFERVILRSLLFWDSHVIYFKDREFSRDAWNNGVGAGFRVYIKDIVIPLLGFDVGWGIEDQTYSTYFNLGTQF